MFPTKYLNTIIEYGLLLFVFLIPWQARLILSKGSIGEGYWEYGTKSLYATEVLLLVILFTIIVRGAIYIAKHKPRFRAKRLLSPIGALMMLIIWAGASMIWSADSSIAFERWIILIEAIVVFLMLSSRAVSFKKLSWAIILSGLVQAMFGIWQFLMQYIPASTWIGIASQQAENLGVSVVETDLRRWLRAYGTFGHPNILAGWLVLSLMLVVHKMRKQSQNLIDVLQYPIYIILLFGLLASFSRSAWLGFAIFLILVSLRGVSCTQRATRQSRVNRNEHGIASVAGTLLRNDKIKIWFTTILCVLSFAIIFSEPFMGRFNPANRLEIKSNMERTASVKDGWEIIKKHPILGVGLGNYGLAVYHELDASQEAWFYQPIHNVPLLIWAELGIIGVLIFLVFGFWFLVFLWRAKNASYLVFLIPLGIIGLLDHYLWSLYSGMMILAVYFGIVMQYYQNRQHS